MPAVTDVRKQLVDSALSSVWKRVENTGAVAVQVSRDPEFEWDDPSAQEAAPGRAVTVQLGMGERLFGVCSMGTATTVEVATASDSGAADALAAEQQAREAGDDALIPLTQKAAASGVASLGADSILLPSQRSATYGTLLGRPSAAVAGDRALYFATDDNGGALWQVQGGAWVLIGPKKAELARVTYAVADDVLRGLAFRTFYGPADATPATPANALLQMTWTSRGLPVVVEAKATVQEDATAAQYLWTYIDLLGGSAVGTTGYADLQAAPANGYVMARPSMLFTDAAGTVRTVGIGGAAQAGNHTLRVGNTPALLTAREV